MNTVVTSREQILAASRQLILEKGISALNMRAVAGRCNVAVGSVYNYFPSKADLINAAVADVWEDIFRTDDLGASPSFPECVQRIFTNFQNGSRRYPGFFTLHSMGFAAEERAEGRRTMDRFFDSLRAAMRQALDNDPRVKRNAFSKQFDEEDFLNLVFSSCVALTLEHRRSCDALLETIRRCIY